LRSSLPGSTRQKRWVRGSSPRMTTTENDDGESALSRQRLLEIGDDVVGLLEPDREPHHVRPGAGLHLLRIRQLPVRGRRRMDDQRARVADIGEMREQLHVRHELDTGVVSTFEAEREYRTGALRTIFLGEVVVAVAGQARIAHPGDARLLHQPFGDDLGVVTVALHAQRQRLYASEDEEGVEW